MATGPFLTLKTVYTLSFPNLTVKAHLKGMSSFEAERRGLDISKTPLEALLADPKDDGGVIEHDAVATVSPSFRGLSGTFRVRARPESRLIPVVQALGVKIWGEFTENAASAGNDLTDIFTRKRFVPSGGKTETGGPAGSWESETVTLKYLPSSERGDEYSDFDPVRAEALALAGTLQNGDILSSPVHGTYQVRGVANERDYEKARLER